MVHRHIGRDLQELLNISQQDLVETNNGIFQYFSNNEFCSIWLTHYRAMLLISHLSYIYLANEEMQGDKQGHHMGESWKFWESGICWCSSKEMILKRFKRNKSNHSDQEHNRDGDSKRKGVNVLVKSTAQGF